MRVLDYAWLMLLFPALGTLVISLFGVRLSRRAIGWLAPGTVALSFGVATWTLLMMLSLPPEARSREVVLWSWMAAVAFSVDVALLVDQLSVTMALVVTGVGFLIHVYSVGYMRTDPRYPRFFAYLNLFILMMLTLVLANNYLLLYVGWEGVGAVSYLLIGFWFEKPSAADAAKKAFIVNRIGDFALVIALLAVWSSLGTLRFADLAGAAQTQWTAGARAVTAITLLILFAATAKSAQLPLYVWLPDAMAGPTPVSALIHAATMVTAGVYVIARSHVLFDLAPVSALWVAVVGATTALFAATIALAQTDLKRILAYSTVSQLGYMFLALGVGAYASGIFHLITQALFKALLFLGAGNVMHALAGELDIRRMGNLRARMPVTHWTFLIGAAALAGIPLFSGFFSKDAILWYAWQQSPLLWLVGMITSAFTALYAFRMLFVPFWGRERNPTTTAHAHDPAPTMTAPLVVLASGAALAGFIGLPRLSLIDAWLEPAFAVPGHAQAEGSGAPSAEWILFAVSGLVALASLGFAYRAYVVDTRIPGRVRGALGWIAHLVEKRYFIEEAYAAGFAKPARKLAQRLGMRLTSAASIGP